MLSLGYATIILLLIIMGAVGAAAGYIFANARQRRAAGGKSINELKTELNEYKSNVTEHFQTTAGLLQNMTEQYRSVYEHMAAGAEQLCDTSNTTAQIESLRTGLLPTPDVAAVPKDSEHPVEFDASAADRDVSSEPLGQVDDSAGGVEHIEAAKQIIAETSSAPSTSAAIDLGSKGSTELSTTPETAIEEAEASGGSDDTKLA